MKNNRLARTVAMMGLSLFLAGATLFAQQAEPQQPPIPTPTPAPQGGAYPQPVPLPAQPQIPGDPNQAQMPPAGGYAITPPSGDLTLPAGTVVSVRVNRPISTRTDKPGDGFAAVLQQPLVANGYVVAQRGQNVLGRVTVSEKAGRVAGTSKLGLELVELTVADGQQAPIKTELVEQKGNTAVGRDAGAMAGTTALGAAIGAGVNGGVGAGVGAAGGFVVGLAGVLLTRGPDTTVYPETMLVFRLTAPVTINTSRSATAFVPVSPADYQSGPMYSSYRPAPPAYPGGGYYYTAPYPYYYPYPYSAYYGYPGFWFGPSFYFGGRFYGGRVYHR